MARKTLTILSHLASCGATALHFACESGHVQVAQTLVEAGANVEGVNGAGLTPLMAAAERYTDRSL